MSSADFFFKKRKKSFRNIMLWIEISTDILSVLVWVQIVCKGYQQTTKVGTSKERVNVLFPSVYVLLCKNFFFFYSFDLNENCVVVKLIH